MQQWLLVFDSTHHAMAAESRIKGAQLEELSFQTIPTPRQITASCGLSLLFQGAVDTDLVLQVLKAHDIEWAGLYQRQEEGKAPWVPVELTQD